MRVRWSVGRGGYGWVERRSGTMDKWIVFFMCVSWPGLLLLLCGLLLLCVCVFLGQY